MSPSPASAQLALAQRILGRPAPELEDLVAVPAGVSVAARLAVHTDGYPARLRESLRESFPALRHILGDAAFTALAKRYQPQIDAHVANLNFVGSNLPDFLASDSVVLELPFAADLARLEWAVCVAFHAFLAAPFDTSACAHWSSDDWANSVLELQPGVALVRSPWPVRTLHECRHVARSEVDVAVVDRPENVVVYRNGREVATRALDDAEADVLAPLLAGERLDRVMERAAAAGAEASAVSECFGRWAAAGLLAACRTR